MRSRMIWTGAIVMFVGFTAGGRAADDRASSDAAHPVVTPRKAPTVRALDPRMIRKIGTEHVVEGVVSWPIASQGKPSGNAAQACSRVSVGAHHYTPGQWVPESVATVQGTPVDPAATAKGCKYKFLNLPANKSLAIDTWYAPTEEWVPPCVGNASGISSNQAVSLTLPDASYHLSLNLKLDYKSCGWIK